jgi:hypothetical protein
MVEKKIKYLDNEITLVYKDRNVFYENTYKFKASVKDGMLEIYRFDDEKQKYKLVQSYDLDREIEEIMKSSIYKGILLLLGKL